MKFYNFQLREIIEVADKEVKIITMKNGRKAGQTTIVRNGKSLKLFKILGKEEIKVLNSYISNH